MTNQILLKRDVIVYTILTSFVICGLASALVTGSKIVDFGIHFPFSNIVFSIFTFPIVDCICELWGKKVARQTLWLGLASQFLIAIMIQVSIIAPSPSYWLLQDNYRSILSVSGNVVCASLIAFSASQFLDIVIYQRIKEASKGRWLWLRSNLSTFIGQTLDSLIFVSIVFYSSNQKMSIFFGSVVIKLICSFLMTPIVYLIVISTHWYLGSNTFAFKNDYDHHLGGATS